jgi:hypothetical protein
MHKPPPGEDYKGTTADLRTENPWLAAEDLMGRPRVTVTIEAVKRHRGVTFEDNRKEDVIALHFKGATKALVLNKTNRRRLTSLYGTNDCAKWLGKKCTLYVEKLKRPAWGDRTHGIRVFMPELEEKKRNRFDQRPAFEPEDVPDPEPAPPSRIETERDHDIEPPDDWEPTT